MIYSISDIHGDYKQALKLLKQYDVVDDDGKWMAGDSTLVCNGDSTDRGSDGIKVLRFMLNLSQQARNAGGKVIHTMGNHDALILCLALEHLSYSLNWEHNFIFNQNGGKNHEATSLSRLHELRRYVQSFPLMCRVDDVLFQHADGFNFYNQITQDADTPESKIKAANTYCRNQALTSDGAWGLFYDITDQRDWNGKDELIGDYLNSFDSKVVVHGHTGFVGNSPKIYLNDMAINIDAIMSSGYRQDEGRGCLLVIDSPGKDIVV